MIMTRTGNDGSWWDGFKSRVALIVAAVWFCGSAYGQFTLSSGQDFIVESPLPYYSPCSEFFVEQGIFQAPVRQVARLRLNLGSDVLDAGESLRVELFESIDQYIAGASARTNAIFTGPTNLVELLTPSTWTNNQAFARVETLSGSALVTNISLATKYIGPSGCALVYRTNVTHIAPPPQLTLLDSIPPIIYDLNWPTNAAAYRLEEASSPDAKVWKPVTNQIHVLGANYRYSMDPHGGLGPLPPRFFRLRRGP